MIRFFSSAAVAAAVAYLGFHVAGPDLLVCAVIGGFAGGLLSFAFIR